MQSRAIGMGCMRVSTDPDRPTEADARAVLEAGIAAGVSWLDTAHAYGLDDGDLGHNERIVGAVRGEGITVVTKVGMRRPNGRWVPDGKKNTILAQAEASCEALGGPADLMLLHAPDPKTSLATSARALRAVLAAGLARAVGVSNVRWGELAAVRAQVAVSAVELAISPLEESAVRGGVVERCLSDGIRVIAHSPLGGVKKAARLTKHPVLAQVARRHGVSAQTIALAWLYGLHPKLLPIPGARRVETARLAGRAPRIELDPDERARLDGAFPIGRLLRVPREQRAPDAPTNRRVVVLIGFPAAGKSTHARRLVLSGYERLNRDEAGGTLAKLAGVLSARLAAGAERVVMDNTYPERAQRNLVIETAWRHGVPVDCIWLDTPLHEAQVGAVDRMLALHGALLTPEEIKKASKRDPNTFAPRAQFRFRDTLEPPDEGEGFNRVETVAFERTAVEGHDRAGAVFDIDAWTGEPGDEPTLVLAWRPGATEDEIASLRAQLGERVSLGVCAHPAGPPICWCRRPLPGLVVEWMRRERIDPARSRYVGTSRADETLAERLGIPYFASASTQPARDPSKQSISGT